MSSLGTPPSDSPVGWVKQHIERYVATGGEDGHEWRGTRTLLLTVTGRRSGQPHRTALIYAADGDDFLIVASKGGAPEHPLWYLNLAADPTVQVQVGPRVFTATARTATEQERPRMWPLVIAAWPAYVDYQKATEREIPVVVLTPPS